jgi:hypothetical protein
MTDHADDPAGTDAVGLGRRLEPVEGPVGAVDRAPGRARAWLISGAIAGVVVTPTNVAFPFSVPEAADVVPGFETVAAAVLAGASATDVSAPQSATDVSARRSATDLPPLREDGFNPGPEP